MIFNNKLFIIYRKDEGSCFFKYDLQHFGNSISLFGTFVLGKNAKSLKVDIVLCVLDNFLPNFQGALFSRLTRSNSNQKNII